MEHWTRNRPLLPTGVTHISLWKIFPEIFLLPWRRTAAWSWEAYEGSDEECDEDGDEHDDEVEVDDDEFPGKVEAGAPVTLWGFGAASETTIRFREKKNAPKDCFFCSNHVNSVCLFVHLSCLAYSVLFKQAHLFSLLSYKMMDDTFLRRQYNNIRSGFRILTHPSPRLLPDGDPISQTERRPLKMVTLIQRCSPLMLDNESGTWEWNMSRPIRGQYSGHVISLDQLEPDIEAGM